MTTFTMIVLLNARQGRETELEAWFDAIHLREMLDLPGVVSAQRFTLAQVPAMSSQWRMAALYAVETADPATVYDEMMRRYMAGEMTQSDALHEISYHGIFAPQPPLLKP